MVGFIILLVLAALLLALYARLGRKIEATARLAHIGTLQSAIDRLQQENEELRRALMSRSSGRRRGPRGKPT